jgi:ATP-dependent helicase/nuclease subunit A
VRLLLEGAPPSRILCLTYTKAAAANMSARIFDLLAKWATLDDAALDTALQESGGAAPTPERRGFARQLFARAVETPGGLKIQTIHAFCERILHRFPFEANVPAGFRVLDDMERAALLERARSETLADAMPEDHALHGPCCAVAGEIGESGFKALIGEALRFSAALRREKEAARAGRMRRRLGLEEGDAVAAIETLMLTGGPGRAQWLEVAHRLRRGGAKDKDLAVHLENAHAQTSDAAVLEKYLPAFFTTKGEPRGLGKQKIVSQTLQKGDPALLELMQDERDRLASLLQKRKAAAAFERSQAFLALACDVLQRYELFKNRRGVLDFDDLIERTRALLRRSSPSWVLYKLDRQIGHILIDEAQDTSAAQWEILRSLAEEFAQEEQPAPARTLFAVGDEKQSIYSFQGAAPEKFDVMRRAFAERFHVARLPLDRIELHVSFRSSPTILSTVDAVFAHGDNRRGLSFQPSEPAPQHQAWKADAPGLVEIWEPIGAQKTEPDADWRLPMDYVSATDPAVQLATRIAQKIGALIRPESGEWVEGAAGPRAIGPGDVLVLVRKRDAFFEAIIRALKEQHVPVAGADRLELAGHIAVMDLCALARAVLLPQDDLTLATLLKSPLIGLDDDDLIALAPQRKGSLWEALKGAEKETHRDAAARIETWRAAALRLSPFDFFAQALGPDGGRKRLVARLGAEANDAIDEFLNLALGFEQDSAAGLVAFVAAVEELELSIKRDMEAPGDAVRVMTVHAAKGLEAKIVFLPDTCGAPTGRFDPKLFALHDGADDAEEDASLVWSPRAGDDPPVVAAARETLRAAQRDEHHRLLYVALTRAER